MTNEINKENFESKKFKILNAVSQFGIIQEPETWSNNLHVFYFKDMIVEDMVFNYLFDVYTASLKKFRKEFYNN